VDKFYVKFSNTLNFLNTGFITGDYKVTSFAFACDAN
jgi:hypothetical protein